MARGPAGGVFFVERAGAIQARPAADRRRGREARSSSSLLVLDQCRRDVRREAGALTRGSIACCARATGAPVSIPLPRCSRRPARVLGNGRTERDLRHPSRTSGGPRDGSGREERRGPGGTVGGHHLACPHWRCRRRGEDRRRRRSRSASRSGRDPAARRAGLAVYYDPKSAKMTSTAPAAWLAKLPAIRPRLDEPWTARSHKLAGPEITRRVRREGLRPDVPARPEQDEVTRRRALRVAARQRGRARDRARRDRRGAPGERRRARSARRSCRRTTTSATAGVTSRGKRGT